MPDYPALKIDHGCINIVRDGRNLHVFEEVDGSTQYFLRLKGFVRGNGKHLAFKIFPSRIAMGLSAYFKRWKNG